jgi:hypothetical protein
VPNQGLAATTLDLQNFTANSKAPRAIPRNHPRAQRFVGTVVCRIFMPSPNVPRRLAWAPSPHRSDFPVLVFRHAHLRSILRI